MNAFFQILHKQNAESAELYKFSKLEHTRECNTIISELNSNYEFKLPHLSLQDRVMKTIIQMFITSPMSNTRVKFDFIGSIRENGFLDYAMKENIYLKFYKAQRTYHVLNRLAYKYKFRKAPYAIQSDLVLTPINETQLNVICVFQNGQKYLFTVLDLKKIIEGALTHSPFHFSGPLPIKNPYNNLPFDKSTLYNIYFFIKHGTFVMSSLFHQYFLSNFNLKRFQDENEVLIQKAHVKQFIRNSDVKDLRYEILHMLKAHSFTKKLRINNDFPTDRLIDIFRPYLELYYHELYSFDVNMRQISKVQLRNKLRMFYEHNPKFGRKYHRTENNIVLNTKTRTITYDQDHIPFYTKENMQNYNNSHLILIEEELCLDSTADSDEESEQEES
jgi:hypothetical protein